MPSIEVVHDAGLAKVRTFYEEVGYGGGVSAADTVIAALAGERVLGAVRLCEEHGVIVLRGMVVAPDCQRQGIGRALLARCARVSQATWQTVSGYWPCAAPPPATCRTNRWRRGWRR